MDVFCKTCKKHRIYTSKKLVLTSDKKAKAKC